jgi:uncharacterized protein (DUF362 family)
VIKPNLCTERKEQIHTANTSIRVLRAVCEVLQEHTPDITVVESDGARYPQRRPSRTTASTRSQPRWASRF